MLRSGLELLLGTTTAGVCERGEMVRDEVVSARPRVTEGSRDGAEEPKGPSIWCDGFPAAGRACASGEEAAAERSGGQQINQWTRQGKIGRPNKLRHDTAALTVANAAQPRASRGAFRGRLGSGPFRAGPQECRRKGRLTHAAGLARLVIWVRGETAAGSLRLTAEDLG